MLVKRSQFHQNVTYAALLAPRSLHRNKKHTFTGCVSVSFKFHKKYGRIYSARYSPVLQSTTFLEVSLICFFFSCAFCTIIWFFAFPRVFTVSCRRIRTYYYNIIIYYIVWILARVRMSDESIMHNIMYCTRLCFRPKISCFLTHGHCIIYDFVRFKNLPSRSLTRHIYILSLSIIRV